MRYKFKQISLDWKPCVDGDGVAQFVWVDVEFWYINQKCSGLQQ